MKAKLQKLKSTPTNNIQNHKTAQNSPTTQLTRQILGNMTRQSS